MFSIKLKYALKGGGRRSGSALVRSAARRETRRGWSGTASTRASRRGSSGRAGGTQTPRGRSAVSGLTDVLFCEAAAAAAGEAEAEAAGEAAGEAAAGVGVGVVGEAGAAGGGAALGGLGGLGTGDSNRSSVQQQCGVGAVIAAGARRQGPDDDSAPGVCRDAVTAGACLRARAGGRGCVVM